MMTAAHVVQRVNGPALVTCDPLCGPCISVVASAAGVGRYTLFAVNAEAHCTTKVETGFPRWSTPCVARYAPAPGLT